MPWCPLKENEKKDENDKFFLLLFSAGGANDRVTAANGTYVQDFVANLLRTAFPHLTDNQIKITVQGLFNLDQDIPAFKEHLRDFLVQIREFTGEDDSDLFLDERDAALKQAQDEKRKIAISVPGMLNPHEAEEMQEMWKKNKSEHTFTTYTLFQKLLCVCEWMCFDHAAKSNLCDVCQQLFETLESGYTTSLLWNMAD